MAKNVDYSKLRALSKQILECIGDDEEGENPSLPKQDNAINDGGQDANTNFIENEKEETNEASKGSDDDAMGKSGASSPDKKKKKESAMAMFSQSLASKFGK